MVLFAALTLGAIIHAAAIPFGASITKWLYWPAAGMVIAAVKHVFAPEIHQ